MLHKLLMALYLATGLALASIGPETNSLSSNIVAIAPLTNEAEQADRTTCVATLLDKGRLVTASHCLPETLETIGIRCLTESRAAIFVVPVISLRHHTSQDIAVVDFHVTRSCHQPSNLPGISTIDQPVLSLFSQHTLTTHRLELLEDQQLTYIVSDPSCQTQGDSGSPVFAIEPDGEVSLAAILIAGTSDCPGLQILAKLGETGEGFLQDSAQ